MKIASWNVNSVRARLEPVLRWMKEQEPDVLLMQELKTESFPAETFEKIGYRSVAVTQKAYNGVAILSRRPMEPLSATLKGDSTDSHARFLEVRVEGMRIVNLYAPNGNPVGSEKFTYKLMWMERLAAEMAGWLKSGDPVLIGGDFNVIPEDIDCHKPSSWVRDALFQPEPRELFRNLLAMGYTDVFRALHPGEPGQFTYWDYFRAAFEHNRGIRIDHFLASMDVAKRVQSCEVDRAPRGWERPSDHTPIVLTLQ